MENAFLGHQIVQLAFMYTLNINCVVTADSIVFLVVKFLSHLLFSLDLLFVLIFLVFHECVTDYSPLLSRSLNLLSMFGWAAWYLLGPVAGVGWWLVAAFQWSFVRSEAT